MQSAHLLYKLVQFFVGNSVVQQPLFEGIGDISGFFVPPDHLRLAMLIGNIVGDVKRVKRTKIQLAVRIVLSFDDLGDLPGRDPLTAL
jgi:hypothetical protein